MVNRKQFAPNLNELERPASIIKSASLFDYCFRLREKCRSGSILGKTPIRPFRTAGSRGTLGQQNCVYILSEIVEVTRIILISFFLGIWAAPSYGDSIPIGRQWVELNAPKGYCKLSKADSADARVIDYLTDSNANANLVLLVFADCTQLESWRSGSLSGLNDYGYITTPISSVGERYDLTNEAFVSELLNVFEKQDLNFLDNGVKNALQGIDEHSPSAELDDTRSRGVIGSDDKALYWALTQNIVTEQGRSESLVGVMAMTLVSGKSINLNMWRLFEDERTINDLEAHSANWVNRTVK